MGRDAPAYQQGSQQVDADRFAIGSQPGLLNTVDGESSITSGGGSDTVVELLNIATATDAVFTVTAHFTGGTTPTSALPDVPATVRFKDEGDFIQQEFLFHVPFQHTFQPTRPLPEGETVDVAVTNHTSSDVTVRSVISYRDGSANSGGVTGSTDI